MNWGRLRILYLHELRMLVRTKRMVVMSIVLPAIIMPAMLSALRYSQNRRELSLGATTYRYAITGTLLDRTRSLIAGTRDAPGEGEEADRLRSFSLEEVKTSNAPKMLEREELHFYVETLTVGEAETESPEPDPASGNAVTQELRGVPVFRLVYRGNNDASQNGAAMMRRLLERARRIDSERMLRDRGFPVNVTDVFRVEVVSTATRSQLTGSGVGRFLTFVLVMLMFTGGSIAAMDIIAGEKERGTLETLLTTAAGRDEIAAAKQLAITSVAVFITLIQALNFFLYVRLELIPLPAGFALQISTADVFALLLLFLPLAACISAILLTISAYAKTYKEAQLYFFPVYLVGLLPSLAAVLPGVSLRSVIALAPIANVSVAVREILTGRPDPLMICVTGGVMTVTAAWLMRRSAMMLTREDIISPVSLDAAEAAGGPGLFQKRVLQWFAVMWAVIFAAAANVPQLASFRRQLVFNELVVFLGASLLMIRLYKLNVRDALALRPVKPVIWLAVLVAIPCGSIAAHGLFKLLDVFIPVSRSMTEQFSQDLLTGIPGWQIYIFAAFIPAICEEIGFRGVLLHGLRKRFRPEVLTIVAGLIFGMFHFTLFRIAPTAFLGMVLTAVTLLTGSIFPGMLLHFGNNALGVWASAHEISLDGLRWWEYTGTVAILGMALYIIYRNRTPSPDTHRDVGAASGG
jgi:ABC-type Na+ efflux pump permease subunit/membrane protease YdiL (CAAX protease family)